MVSLGASLVQRRLISGLSRDCPNFAAKMPKRITSKHHQKPLGSYPAPPEQEMLWKNRRTIPGGYFQQSISPFQLKFLYPIIHQWSARTWAKTSQMFWWIIWPTTVMVIAFRSIDKLNKLYLKREHYY
ncbi:hypothetical protein BEWA_031210 [Theileria equi strain WA]|uniref:Uncharacterized protein n=1 Tax=Theileria equi strain WA TaxID=1537102 RepID=L0AYD3_THEEQ|nr:hypothetical protein BEWA_031210 [Theileria equi strain WA]AFZ80268.1 hypothetical protein BEWA_031210 [Theileria equi strain WA]|eukprot:XP_004829934.1 hypothetical protein BEWA_031210 [Theileria equi strain WA]